MHSVLRITARDNPAVKHYRRLRDNKRARREERLFVAEGLRIVCDALQYPGLVQQVFVTDTAAERIGALPEFRKADACLRISDAVGESMTDTYHTQGIFAVCRMPAQLPPAALLRPGGRYLVLCDLQDPGNMGMILRTADALGMDAVFSAGSCEMYSPKVVRAAMGSLLRVSVCETSPLPLAALLHQRQILSYAAVPAKDAQPLNECSFDGGCAVWIGNEGNGLPDELIAACGQTVTIPMRGGPESLNAAMAAGILMWEMTRGRKGGAHGT